MTKHILAPKFASQPSQPGEVPVDGPWEGILKPKLRRLHHAEQEFQQAAVARQEAEQRFSQAHENMKQSVERARGAVESFLEFKGLPSGNLNARWDPDTDRAIVVVVEPESAAQPERVPTAREQKEIDARERERLAAAEDPQVHPETERKEITKEGVNGT